MKTPRARETKGLDKCSMLKTLRLNGYFTFLCWMLSFLFIFYIYFYVCVCVVVCHMCASAYRGLKRTSDPLKREFQMVIEWLRAGDLNSSPLE